MSCTYPSLESPVTYLLLDLNGTLHVGDEPTRDAVAAMARLAALQASSSGRLRMSFCSNSSKESTSKLVARLRWMGFDGKTLPDESVFTSLDACKRLCDRLGRKRTLLLLGEDAHNAFPEPSDSSPYDGYNRWFKASPSRPPGALSPTETEELRDCDAVVVGLAPEVMSYAWLDEAFRILSGEYQRGASHDWQAVLVGTHRGLYYRPGVPTKEKGDSGVTGVVSQTGSSHVQTGQREASQQSPLSLGPGAFITALETAAGLSSDQVKIVGKPTREFFAECLAGLGRQAPQALETSGEIVWILGDDAKQDLSLPPALPGIEDPLRGVTIRRGLMRTGKYRNGDEEKVTDSGPDGVWDDFAQWVEWFAGEWQTN